MNYPGWKISLHAQQQSLDTHAYIREEFDLVRSIFRNIDGYKGYLEGYSRVGRSVGLQTGRQQLPVLNLLREWEKWQIENGFQDHLGLTQLGMVVLDDLNGELPKHMKYRSVLVDEFQDFSTLDLNLLLQIPTERPNGLFLAGDVAQKVFAKEMNLESGIGRERHHRRITKNYRNTRQILEAAMLLLDDQPEAIRDGDSEVRILAQNMLNAMARNLSRARQTIQQEQRGLTRLIVLRPDTWRFGSALRQLIQKHFPSLKS